MAGDLLLKEVREPERLRPTDVWHIAPGLGFLQRTWCQLMDFDMNLAAFSHAVRRGWILSGSPKEGS